MQCVTETERGKTYFPKTIPRPRSNLATKLQLSLGVVMLIAAYYYTEDKSLEQSIIFLGSFFCTFVLTFFVLELVTRCCMLMEEVKHLTTRYNGVENLLWSVFAMPKLMMVWYGVMQVALVVCIYITAKYECPWSFISSRGTSTLFYALFSMLLLRSLLPFETGHIYDSLFIQRMNGLNYGAGMASSFYHGYLKLVLPKTGTEEKDLFEQIQQYTDTEGVRFAEYKLFILIPQSTICHVSLKNSFSPSIDECSSLEKKIKTVAGVQNRVYKNSVYRLSDNTGKRIYVCAEYATPLKTFNDVMNSQGQYAAYYKQQKSEIVLQFYLTLKKILDENPEAKSLCELIYYDDKDASGEFYDIGKIILHRLYLNKKKKKYM